MIELLEHAGAQRDGAQRLRWEAFLAAQVRRLTSQVIESDFDPVVLARLFRVRSFR